MAHKTLADGTAYEISGGKTLVNGTAYSIKNGKTLVEGTAYEVGFVSGIPITIKGYGGMGAFDDPNASVTIDGIQYIGNPIGETSTIVYVPSGTVITCKVGARGSSVTATISLNGTIVASQEGGFISTSYKTYEYPVTLPITITLTDTIVGTSGAKSFGTITIEE